MSIPTVPTQDGKGELTVEEIKGRYKDRWVALLVTKRDRNLQPLAGRVVAEDVDRYRLREKLAKYADVCIFYAGELPCPLLL